jgi:hypothetical protein
VKSYIFFQLQDTKNEETKMFKGNDKNAFNEHSFAKGLMAYVNTDEFDSTLYSRKSKKCKTDTGRSGSSPEGGGEPAGTGFTVQGHELISDVIKNAKDIFEPLYKVRAVLLTRILAN